MSRKWTLHDEILFGADYNPEQWFNRPDILAEDVRLMQEAGITVISLGMFSWSSLEPQEGVYAFLWMDELLDNLHAHGIKVFLATPSGAKPAWMAAKYPEVLRVSADNKRDLYGKRHNHCYSSPVYREKCASINSKLAHRYSAHPAVVLWHISNEYSGECHCDFCQERFVSWLKLRYGTLEKLNHAWWTSFWSHTYTDWNQIHSPVPHGETTLHGLNLDWKRFVTHMTVDFMNHEVQSVRSAGSKLPVTTNMMASCEIQKLDPGIDYWKFKDSIDIASWDSYPAWHMPGHSMRYIDHSDDPADDYRRASEEAFQHDLFRCLGGGSPFLLMESTPTQVNWQLQSKIKKPGMIALSGLHAVSHGANSVQYFQWRKSRGSYEKFHGAVIDHSGSQATRVFREVSAFGSMLKSLAFLAGSAYRAESAIIFNWENWWALEDAKSPVNGDRKAYLETVKKHYHCLRSNGIPLDVISGEEDFSQYKLICAPMLYMISQQTANRLIEYVRSGGTLVTTYMSGLVDAHDLCHDGGAPGPLSGVLGLTVEETDALFTHEDVRIMFSPLAGELDGSSSNAHDYQDVIHLQGALAAGWFQGGIADGMAALTVHRFGKGTAWYAGSRLDAACLLSLYRNICKDSSISSFFDDVVYRDQCIDIQKRFDQEKEYLFVMNFSHEQQTVEFSKQLQKLPSGEVSAKWVLPPWGSLVMQQL